MTIFVRQAEANGKSLDQIPGDLDHRREVPPLNSNPTNATDNLADQVARSVVAIVESTHFEKIENATPEKYWRVTTQAKTVQEHLLSELRKTQMATCKELASRVCTAKADKDKAVPIQQELLNLANVIDPKTCNIKESLRQQPAFATATGCIMQGGRILTCAHLDESTASMDYTQRFILSPKKYRILFDYRIGSITAASVLPYWQVREIDRVEMMPWRVDRVVESKTDFYDVAILKLVPLYPDKPEPQLALGVPISTTVPKGASGAIAADSLFAIGCPTGMPLKYTEGICLGETFQTRTGKALTSRYDSTLEQFKGSSGSPVFRQSGNNRTVEICGVHSASAPLSRDKLARSIKTKAKQLITQKLGRDPGLDDAVYEGLYHSKEYMVLASEDNTSYTFDKVVEGTPEVAEYEIECRVDAVPLLLTPLNQFAPKTFPKPSPATANYASLSIVFTFENPIGSPLTLGILQQNGQTIEKSTNPTDKPGLVNKTAYFFADFGVPQDRSGIQTVTVALRSDLDDRVLKAKIEEYDDGEAFEEFLNDGDTSNGPRPYTKTTTRDLREVEETDLDKGWKAYWRTNLTKRGLLNLDPGPVIVGGWFGDDNRALGDYTGYGNAPGLLGLLQENSIWTTQCPNGGKITLRFNRASPAGSAFKFESFYFQGNFTFKGAPFEIPTADGKGTRTVYRGRVERWIGPLVTKDHMLTDV